MVTHAVMVFEPSEQNLRVFVVFEEGTIMARSWVFQDHKQREKLGSKAPWSAGWIDPEGRRRSKRIGSRSMATKYARKLEGQLSAGIYEDISNKS